MRSRKKLVEPGKNRVRRSGGRQLIGEEIGPVRVRQTRLFKTDLDAEIWVRAAPGRRSRLVMIGSAAWMRALDAELKIASAEK
jgi:hypothetical protein